MHAHKSSDIATVCIDLCILLFALILKATQPMLHEIIFIMCVSVGNNPEPEACVSHIIGETW